MGVNNSSILTGKTFIYLPSISLYQSECKLVIAGIRLVENQYWRGCWPLTALGQGVGLDVVQIGANTLNWPHSPHLVSSLKRWGERPVINIV